jgi:hypothetical protein
MPKIKAISIDAVKSIIEEIELEINKDEGTYDALCKYLGCFNVESLELDNKINLLYVDGCGLLKPQEKYIKLKDYPSFLPGKAVILGYNERKDEYKSHSLNIEKLKKEIMFLTQKEAKALAQMIDEQNSKWVKHPNVLYHKLSDLF